MPFGTTRNGNAGSAESPSRRRRSGAGALRFRVLSAVLFLPPFLFITRAGSLPFLLLVGAIVLFATWETYGLLGGKRIGRLLPLGLLSAALLLLLLYRGKPAEVLFFLTLFLAVLLLAAIGRAEAASSERVAGPLFALLYAAWLPGFLVLLRELPRAALPSYSYSEGAAFVWLLFLVVWGGDTGAYTAGRLLGRTPLAPSISPKKTVEGAFGGLATATGGAFLGAAFLVPELRAWDAVALGVGGGVLGQAGDLVESRLKRDAGVKDSASFIPGHGGVLDRFDSIFLAAPFVYYYLRLVVFRG